MKQLVPNIMYACNPTTTRTFLYYTSTQRKQLKHHLCHELGIHGQHTRSKGALNHAHCGGQAVTAPFEEMGTG
ncbi:MAG: hypothetical protein P4L40_04965 [Terracidiphilus sp.]|nr:hypothetical protein [Terracidiphilus sp.]